MAACRSAIEAEHAATDALAGHLGEEVFHGIEPGPGGRGEMEDPARVAGEPKNAATVQTRTGARQTFRRKPNGPSSVMPWELPGCTNSEPAINSPVISWCSEELATLQCSEARSPDCAGSLDEADGALSEWRVPGAASPVCTRSRTDDERPRLGPASSWSHRCLRSAPPASVLRSTAGRAHRTSSYPNTVLVGPIRPLYPWGH